MTRTFLDAGVLIEGARSRASLATPVMRIIDDPEREFVVSSFLELEVLPKAIFNRKTFEVEFYQLYFQAAQVRIAVDEVLMKAAAERAARLGLNAVDAVHLEAAIAAGAGEFYTTEKPTKPLFRETALRVIAI